MKFIRSASKLFSQDYFFSVFSKMVGVILAIIYSAFYNRYLGAVLKGEAAIISNYISLISSFAAAGMYQAYPFYKKKGEDVFYPFVNNMTSLYSLMMLSCLLLAFILPVDINLRIAVVIVPVQSYIRHINYVVMLEAPRRRNISSMLIGVMDLAVVLSFFALSESTYGHLVCILLIQNVISLLISYCNLKVNFKKCKFDLSQVPKFLRYGIIPMFTLILMTLNYRVDVLMLEFFNISVAEIGVYSVGISLAEKIWLVPDAVKDILMSRLSNGATPKEVAKVTRVSVAISLMMLLLMCIFGRPVIWMLYGVEFIHAYEILIIMLVGIVGMVFYKMVYAYNVVNGKRAINLLFLGAAAISNIIANLVLIPIGGIFAAAWASVISYLLCGAAFLIYFHHTAGIKYTEMLVIQKEDIVYARSMLNSKK